MYKEDNSKDLYLVSKLALHSSGTKMLAQFFIKRNRGLLEMTDSRVKAS